MNKTTTNMNTLLERLKPKYKKRLQKIQKKDANLYIEIVTDLSLVVHVGDLTIDEADKIKDNLCGWFGGIYDLFDYDDPLMSDRALMAVDR